MTATPHSKSWLELDSARCIRNLAGIRRLVGSAEIMAVLKANAYGAGAVPIAGILAGAGVEEECVAGGEAAGGEGGDVAVAAELAEHGDAVPEGEMWFVGPIEAQ